MLCQKCNQRPATVLISQTVNQKTSQVHLCDVCAGEQTTLVGLSPFSVTFDPSSMLKDFFSTLFPGFDIPAPPGPEGAPGRTQVEEPTAQCPACGFQFPLFKQSGRLGCPQCYKSFSALLEPVVTSLHGNVRHVEESLPAVTEGAPPAPQPSPAADPEDAELSALRRKLKAAVEGERFEEAASIRDLIKTQKNKV